MREIGAEEKNVIFLSGKDLPNSNCNILKILSVTKYALLAE